MSDPLLYIFICVCFFLSVVSVCVLSIYMHKQLNNAQFQRITQIIDQYETQYRIDFEDWETGDIQ